MSSFTKPLILKFLNVAPYFELFEEFAFYIDHTETVKETFTVPKGFRTDFASIPRSFKWLISPVGLHGKAAVLHDYLCEYGYMTRKEADEIFLEAMKVLGVGWLKRTVMYRAVRAFSIVTRAKAGYKNDT